MPASKKAEKEEKSKKEEEEVEEEEVETPEAQVVEVEVPVRSPLQIKVDNFTSRDDNDALEGHFARIVKGDDAGAFGVFDHVAEYGKDGYPKTVVFQKRDTTGELVTVPYADLRPATEPRR